VDIMRSKLRRGWPPAGGLARVAGLALALAASGCATAGYTPDATPSMPVVRMSLAPEYRFFYDALEGYGDWTLIEPYGYVFRPDVNFVAWRPYVEGFWVPTDLYGWVWVSSEPFGWATYHYGDWFYDRFQGWVWLPGVQWGPAWVDWRATNDYVGWAPLMPAGVDPGIVPGGPYVFVPMTQLAGTGVASGILDAKQVGPQLEASEPVRNYVERDGVTFNRGPSLERIERAVGPLRRVTVDDVISARSRVPGGRLHERAGADTSGRNTLIEETRRAALEAAREARALAKSGGITPLAVPIVRPIGNPVAEPVKAPAPRRQAPRPPRKSAPPDSTG
jgi:Family of unknown function (DUF6600)